MNPPASPSLKPTDRPARLWSVILVVAGVVMLGFVLWAGKDWRTARQVVDALELEGKSDTEKFTVGYAKWGTYWAAMINGVLCLGLGLTTRWWLGGGNVGGEKVRLPRVGKWGWAMLAVALVLGGVLRWHRTELSFYNDEAHCFKRYIVGTARVDPKNPTGGLKWRAVSWLKTFFFNQVGNNAVPASALGRISHAAWLGMAKAAPGTVNERAVRLPGVLASLGGIVFLWMTARRLFSTAAAGWVALLAASHFWMVRFGNEARGYALTLLALSAMGYFLCRARESQQWRWWVGFGLMQFLTLWSFSGAIYFVAVLDGLLLLMAGIGVLKGGRPAATLLRPLVGMMLGGMLTLQLMLTTLPQLVAAIQVSPAMRGVMEAGWWRDVMSGLSSGLRWETGTGSLREGFLSKHPWMALLWVNGLGLLAVGLWNLRRAGSLPRVLCLAGLAAIVLGWVAMSARGLFLHQWYVLYALPGLMLLCGRAFPDADAAKPWAVRLASGSAALLVAFHLVVNFQLWDQGKENIRASMQSMPKSPALLGALYSDVDAYDKSTIALSQKSEEQAAAGLEALIAIAGDAGLPLFIDFTHRDLLARQMPGVLARLENPAEFKLVATFPTFDEPQFHHYLVEWVGVQPKQ